MSWILRLQDEDGLGQIELTRNGLHVLGIERIGAKDDGQGVAAETFGCENVEGVEGEAHGKVPSWSRRWSPPESMPDHAGKQVAIQAPIAFSSERAERKYSFIFTI